MSHTFKFSAIATAALMAACGGGGSGGAADPADPLAAGAPGVPACGWIGKCDQDAPDTPGVPGTPGSAPVISAAPTTEPALEAAKSVLAALDASRAASIPAKGVDMFAMRDGCYLGDGRSKALSIAEWDAEPKAVASQQFAIGSTRGEAQVIAERSITNADGTPRREIDIKYATTFKDGSKNESVEETIISGSSSGSKMADGSTCTTPESKSDWRFFGNRKVVNTFVNTTNEVVDRTTLATGLPVSPAVIHRKYVTLGIQDPAKVATYTIISGPGLTTTVGGIAMTLKLIAPRLLRDAPEFAGKNGNFVNWKDDDNFRVCRTASGFFEFAETANCVLHGATSDRWEVSNPDPVALDTAFGAYGFAAGGVYTIKVYADDGWKTVNGQLGKTPIATYSSTLNNLPFSAAALAPAGGQSLYPARLSSSKTASEVGAAILAKSEYSLNLTWAAPGAMPDSRKFAHSNVYFFEQGRATAGTTFNPASRQTSLEYAGPTATALNATVPAAAAQLITPTYGEYGIQYNNRNGNNVRAVFVWQ